MLEYKQYIKNKDSDIKQLVAMFHGYGSNQDDLITLAPELSTYLPNTLFVSFNAPFPFEGSVGINGRQWFSLLDRSRKSLLSGLKTVKDEVIESVKTLLSLHNLTEKQLCFLGFSQGTMLSLYLTISGEITPHLVLGYSGRIIADNYPKFNNSTKIILIHGQEDEVITVQEMLETKDILIKRGFNVESYISRYLAHGIDAEGIRKGGTFLKHNFLKRSFS